MIGKKNKIGGDMRATSLSRKLLSVSVIVAMVFSGFVIVSMDIGSMNVGALPSDHWTQYWSGPGFHGYTSCSGSNGGSTDSFYAEAYIDLDWWVFQGHMSAMIELGWFNQCSADAFAVCGGDDLDSDDATVSDPNGDSVTSYYCESGYFIVYAPFDLTTSGFNYSHLYID